MLHHYYYIKSLQALKLSIFKKENFAHDRCVLYIMGGVSCWWWWRWGGGRYARWGDVEGAMWLLVRGAGRRIGGLGWLVSRLRLQSFTQYLERALVLVWNGTLRGEFNFYFSNDFRWCWRNFYFAMGNRH